MNKKTNNTSPVKINNALAELKSIREQMEELNEQLGNLAKRDDQKPYRKASRVFAGLLKRHDEIVSALPQPVCFDHDTGDYFIGVESGKSMFHVKVAITFSANVPVAAYDEQEAEAAALRMYANGEFGLSQDDNLRAWVTSETVQKSVM